MTAETDRRAARLLHHRADRLDKGDPLVPPLVSSSVFHLPGEPEAAYRYARFATPTWEEAEAQLSLLEDAPAVAFPSGMAAIAALFQATLMAGSRVVLPSDGYYTTRALAERFLAPMGIEVVTHPTPGFENARMEGAALVLAETPSNPGLDVCDIAAVAERARAAGAIFAIDNTTMTPLLQRPLDLGADVVVAADTKAPGGHSDLLLGHLAARDEELVERTREWRKLSGAVPGALEAWLLHRGLETLEVRLSRMCETAALVAPRLRDHPAVKTVRYPGLPDDPSHAVASRQMDAPGFLIGLTLDDADTAERFLGACPFVAQTTSFGAVHTSGERRARWGDDVDDGFVRLSVGCEPAEVLWEALAQALDGSG